LRISKRPCLFGLHLDFQVKIRKGGQIAELQWYCDAYLQLCKQCNKRKKWLILNRNYTIFYVNETLLISWQCVATITYGERILNYTQCQQSFSVHLKIQLKRAIGLLVDSKKYLHVYDCQLQSLCYQFLVILPKGQDSYWRMVKFPNFSVIEIWKT